MDSKGSHPTESDPAGSHAGRRHSWSRDRPLPRRRAESGDRM